MAVSPSYAEGLANPVVAVYADAERYLLQRIGEALARGIDAPRWAEEQLLQYQLLQAQLDGYLSTADAAAQQQLAVALGTAYNRGQAGAETDLAELVRRGITGYRAQLTGLPAIERLVNETAGKLDSLHSNVLRAVGDQFRDIVQQSVSPALLGLKTRRQVTQDALNRMAAAGITGFTDVRGREWSLSAYAEMATRSATARAAVLGHTDRLQAAGQDLVMVSDAPQECRLCRPWEGKVLSITGRITSGVGFEIAGTLDQAMAAGFMHPGCRHSTSLYQHGITKPLHGTADPQGDRDRQHLRYLERQVRAAKRQEAVALDPQAKARARRRVRDYQARIKHHTDTTTAKRQRDREQLPKVTPPKAPRTFDKVSDDELDEKLGEAFASGGEDTELVEALSVEMEVRERYTGSATAHFRRRNTMLDQDFKGASDEDIREQVEAAVASGDPEAGGFVDLAFEELKRRAYSGKSVVLPRVAQPKPRAESKAAQRRRVRAEFDLYQAAQRDQLEEATNGNLIRKDRLAEFRQKYGSEAGAMRVMLEGDVTAAYRYASEEVRRYWEAVPRVTFAEYAVRSGLQDEVLMRQARRAGERARDAAMRAEERPRPVRRRRR